MVFNVTNKKPTIPPKNLHVARLSVFSFVFLFSSLLYIFINLKLEIPRGVALCAWLPAATLFPPLQTRRRTLGRAAKTHVLSLVLPLRNHCHISGWAFIDYKQKLITLY